MFLFIIKTNIITFFHCKFNLFISFSVTFHVTRSLYIKVFLSFQRNYYFSLNYCYDTIYENYTFDSIYKREIEVKGQIGYVLAC